MKHIFSANFVPECEMLGDKILLFRVKNMKKLSLPKGPWPVWNGFTYDTAWKNSG
jgi:hypothetical protein